MLSIPLDLMTLIPSTSKQTPKKPKQKIEMIPLDSSQLTFVSGQRGNLKLVINGYSFVRNKGNQSHIYWRCSNFRRQKCLAKAMTNYDNTRCTLTYSYHNHNPDINDDNKE